MDGRNDGNFNFAFQISRDEISSCAVRMDYLNTVVFTNFDNFINDRQIEPIFLFKQHTRHVYILKFIEELSFYKADDFYVAVFRQCAHECKDMGFCSAAVSAAYHMKYFHRGDSFLFFFYFCLFWLENDYLTIFRYRGAISLSKAANSTQFP